MKSEMPTAKNPYRALMIVFQVGDPEFDTRGIFEGRAAAQLFRGGSAELLAQEEASV